MTTAKRLEHLERLAGPSSGFAAMLVDELHVAALDKARALLAAPDVSDEDRELAAATVRDVEAQIRAAAARQSAATWPGHAERLNRYWKGTAPFVPSLIGWDYDDWEKPRVMERRAALLARPDVRQLVDQARASTMVEAG